MFIGTAASSIGAIASGNSTPDVYDLASASDYNIGASATTYFYTDGSGLTVGLGGFNWVTPSSATTRYSHEIYVSHTSGPAPTGDSLNTWLPMTSTRAWTNSSSGTVTTLSVQIRRGSPAVVVASATVTLEYVAI